MLLLLCGSSHRGKRKEINSNHARMYVCMYAPPIWRSRHTICDDERESLNSHVQRKSPGELWAVYNCQSDTTKNLGGSTSPYTYTQLRRGGRQRKCNIIHSKAHSKACVRRTIELEATEGGDGPAAGKKTLTRRYGQRRWMGCGRFPHEEEICVYTYR